MALRAFQKKNSSVDGHAVNDNFVWVCNRRGMSVPKDNEDQILSEVEVFSVGVHLFFAETISKGKKNDHAMHNVALDALIKHYQSVFPEETATPLRHIIVWTDNAPYQYRCRQNFIKVLTIAARHHGIGMTHRLAVVDNFKGIHDAVGKDPAHLVRSLELIGIRSKNAYAVFENCSRCLQQTEDETKWKGYETKKEWRLRNKGSFGINTRTCWFLVDTREQLAYFSLKYPGRILLVDRSQIQDTLGEKPIDGTTLLHEVCSVATDVPTSLPRIWKAMIANLPCNCPHCTLDPINVLCPYSPWRKAMIT